MTCFKSFSKLSDGLWECLYRFSGGWVRTSIIRLENKAFLVYSPGPGISSLAKEILKDAEKVFLLAPNSYHNLGLNEWVNEFKAAEVICAVESKDRIFSKTRLEPAALSSLKGFIGEKVEVFPLPGTRAGETWVRYYSNEKIFWLVGDAFFNFKKLASNLVFSTIMKINRMGPGLSSSRLFRLVGLKNIDLFLSTVMPLLEEPGCHILVPCHGRIDEEGDFNERAAKILEKIYL